ncbi:uncharacterized protein LOC126834210 [Adelges cooleyi]|uniref:uncharacterized protein LOC126834210 n=1 Tax=Adelges cooleyi TaxID=133065 RepID=UPI00217F3830|nr:uncharacterized protein LOC126834210 [Adelges cooleyi]
MIIETTVHQSPMQMDALPKVLPGKTIDETVSKLESEEVRNLLHVLVNQVNDKDTRGVALKWLNAIIVSNRMRIIRDPTLHEALNSLEPLSSPSYVKLLKLKGRLDTITERMTKRKSGTLEPYITYMDEDSTDKIDKFLLMNQVKPLESDDDDNMDLSKIV